MQQGRKRLCPWLYSQALPLRPACHRRLWRDGLLRDLMRPSTLCDLMHLLNRHQLTVLTLCIYVPFLPCWGELGTLRTNPSPPGFVQAARKSHPFPVGFEKEEGLCGTLHGARTRCPHEGLGTEPQPSRLPVPSILRPLLLRLATAIFYLMRSYVTFYLMRPYAST